MKYRSSRPVFVNGSRFAAGEVFDLPERYNPAAHMTRVDDDEPLGLAGTPTPSRRKGGRKPAAPTDEPETFGELARRDAKALEIPGADGQPAN